MSLTEIRTDLPTLALTPDQAAKSMNVSRSTLDRWTREGKIRCKRDGKVVLYSIRAIQDWLDGGNTDTVPIIATEAG